MYATVGLHPHDASKLDAEWDGARPAGRRPSACVAIGEAGFDLHYEHSPRDEQERAFRRQIRARARRSTAPLVIHSREAWDDTFRVLDDEGVPERTIFHCFTGGPDEARRRARPAVLPLVQRHRVVQDGRRRPRRRGRIAPADRVLVETDSPYLTPEPHRGKPNEPAFLAAGRRRAGARRAASTVEEIAALTRANAARVFGVVR